MGRKPGWDIPVWGVKTHTPTTPSEITESRMSGRWVSLRTGDRIGPARQLLPRFGNAFTELGWSHQESSQ